MVTNTKVADDAFVGFHALRHLHLKEHTVSILSSEEG